jgi:hypothetical protein
MRADGSLNWLAVKGKYGQLDPNLSAQLDEKPEKTAGNEREAANWARLIFGTRYALNWC